MTESSANVTTEDIRRAATELARKVPGLPDPPPIPMSTDGEELCADERPATRLCNCLIQVAIRSNARTLTISRKRFKTTATFSDTPTDVPPIAMPRNVMPRISMRFINMIDGKITKNEDLELIGTILLRYERKDYQATVHMWTERGGICIRLTFVPQ